MVGYSVGELTAYGVAGWWSPATAVETAVQRARYMDACVVQQAAQGLMAITGMPVEQIPKYLQPFAVYVAIETDAESVIAGGSIENLLAAQTQLEKFGVRTTLLPVSVASHTPLMQAAVVPYARWLERLDWQLPACSVMAGVTAQSVTNQQAAASAMLQQLTATIHWAACMDAMVERGISVALELGPGAALSRLLRQRHPQITCRSLSDFRSLAGALAWLERNLA